MSTIGAVIVNPPTDWLMIPGRPPSTGIGSPRVRASARPRSQMNAASVTITADRPSPATSRPLNR
jgi:hypothetical protein